MDRTNSMRKIGQADIKQPASLVAKHPKQACYKGSYDGLGIIDSIIL